MSSSPFTRRYFIQSSAAFAATAVTASQLLAQDKPAAPKDPKKPAEKPKKKKTIIENLSPGEKVNTAIIGCGGRGGSHLSDLLGLSDHANVVAVCDPDEKRAGGFAQRVEEETGVAPPVFTDVRKMLEATKEIQAVSIATPNHWHALSAIYAIQAGKDVYVEKPCSHNVVEGRRLVEFGGKHNKIVLHGTQSRSSKAMNTAMNFIHNGGIGQVYLARATCYKRRNAIDCLDAPIAAPQGVDYDLWAGPAPMDPVTRKKFHYDWHWFWNYGNGDIGNQGVHQMDIALWGLGKRELPKRVQSIGGRFGYKDCAETPNTQIATLDYDDSQVIFEVRGLTSKPPRGVKEGVANVFYGSEGSVVVHNYSNTAAYDAGGVPIEMPAYEGELNGNHFTTFIKAVKSRKLDFFAGEVEAGHLGSAMCHMANISQRLGKPAKFDAQNNAFGDDKAAMWTMRKMEEHLKENKVVLEETEYLLGPSLTMDPKTEKFTNNDAANELLTRKYRAPYLLPEVG